MENKWIRNGYKTDSNSGNETGGNTGDSMESAMEIQMALPMGLQEPEWWFFILVPEALTAVTIPEPAITPGVASDGTINSGTTDGSSSNGTGSSTNADRLQETLQATLQEIRLLLKRK